MLQRHTKSWPWPQGQDSHPAWVEAASFTACVSKARGSANFDLWNPLEHRPKFLLFMKKTTIWSNLGVPEFGQNNR